MNDATQSENPAKANDAQSTAPATPATTTADPVRKWIQLTLVLIVALIAWYLAADRYTPFTSQARVDAFVIPIAPQVSGNVLSVSVTSNQQVEADDELLQLDSARYQFAVDRARADLEAAQQEFGAASAGVSSADASVKAAQAELVRAGKDYSRLQRIINEDPGAVSTRRLEMAEATQVAAQSMVSSAQAELERARQTKGQEGADNSRLQAAQASLA
jgi:multidrug resistance efflux pump